MLLLTTEDALYSGEPSDLKKSGQLARCLDLTDKPISSCWLPDNSELFLCSSTKIYRYNPTTHALSAVYTALEPLSCVVCKDSTTIICGEGSKVQLLQLESGPSQCFETHTQVTGLSLNTTRSLLASSTSTSVYIHTLGLGASTSTPLRGLAPHGPITACVFHPHSPTKLLVAAGKTLLVYETTRPSSPSKVIPIPAGTDILAVACSPFSTSLLATVSSDGHLTILDIDKEDTTNPIYKSVQTHTPLTSLDFSPEGGVLFMGSADGRLLSLQLRALDRPPKVLPVGDVPSRVQTITVQKKAPLQTRAALSPSLARGTLRPMTPLKPTPSKSTLKSTIKPTPKSTLRPTPTPTRPIERKRTSSSSHRDSTKPSPARTARRVFSSSLAGSAVARAKADVSPGRAGVKGVGVNSNAKTGGKEDKGKDNDKDKEEEEEAGDSTLDISGKFFHAAMYLFSFSYPLLILCLVEMETIGTRRLGVVKSPLASRTSARAATSTLTSSANKRMGATTKSTSAGTTRLAPRPPAASPRTVTAARTSTSTSNAKLATLSPRLSASSVGRRSATAAGAVPTSGAGRSAASARDKPRAARSAPGLLPKSRLGGKLSAGSSSTGTRTSAGKEVAATASPSPIHRHRKPSSASSATSPSDHTRTMTTTTTTTTPTSATSSSAGSYRSSSASSCAGYSVQTPSPTVRLPDLPEIVVRGCDEDGGERGDDYDYEREDGDVGVDKDQQYNDQQYTDQQIKGRKNKVVVMRSGSPSLVWTGFASGGAGLGGLDEDGDMYGEVHENEDGHDGARKMYLARDSDEEDDEGVYEDEDEDKENKSPPSASAMVEWGSVDVGGKSESKGLALPLRGSLVAQIDNMQGGIGRSGSYPTGYPISPTRARSQTQIQIQTHALSHTRTRSQTRSHSPTQPSPHPPTPPDLLRSIMHDLLSEHQRQTAAAIGNLHLDVLRMGRVWRGEVREGMEGLREELEAVREENGRLREENVRLRRGW
ncbi:hypothetical protein FA15DRAFT_696423 [Coprinopsis marcescibilis]|uniref:WD40 repeat-like protein n=1 Tax=Coprinopsis marcescibilis TaxID=230819 RepID=A0A5C3KN28_COPMA|nr:hypothetical protein FA15DRAFT_696423 [Coprinopsis marcescibilis]